MKYVTNGLVGATPKKRGEKGTIMLHAFKALCGAFKYFVKLSGQEARNDIR
jgi:hypothetical protein